MIPRFMPYLDREELLVILDRNKFAVSRFEEEFSCLFEAKYAVAFPYGRSALWALFKALGIENAEVIIPAYTCVVVAHAVVLSGNIPRFVDITLRDFNMNLSQIESALNQRTRAIIATHLFGYPLNVDLLQEIVKFAEQRWGNKIWVIQDCAHAFGARWNGKLVCNYGDAALFGLNISKLITSVFGGMITTNDSELYSKLRGFRDKHFEQPNISKGLRRFLYLLMVYFAFDRRVYGLINLLEEKTPFLNRLTKAYHLDERIHFPPDYMEQMTELEAKVGLVQLRKYSEIIDRRLAHAQYYDKHLRNVPGLQLPPLVEGATYSHYVVLVNNRQILIKELLRRGIQLGNLIQYSIPHMTAYAKYARDQSFANSYICSRSAVNLPVYASLEDTLRARVVESLRVTAAILGTD